MKYSKVRSPRVLALAAAAISGAATAHCASAREGVNRLPPGTESAKVCPKVADANESLKSNLSAEGGLLLEVPEDIETRLNTAGLSANDASGEAPAA